MTNLLETGSPSLPPTWRGQWTACLTLVIVYVTFSVLLPLHRFNFDRIRPLAQALLILVPTVVFMLLQLLLILALAKLRLGPWQRLIGGAVGVGFWLTVLLFFHPLRQFGPHNFEFAYLTKEALMGVGLTVGLSFLGALLSLIVKERNLLLPVALIAMPIDFVGAMTSQGFTKEMVKHAPQIVSSVSVSVPAVTSQTSHGISIGPIAFIGPGDVLFMALFFAAVIRFGLAESRTFWWMYGLLTFSMLLVLRLPDFTVGALVPMGLAVIIANAGLIKLKRDEVFAIGYASLLILVIVGILFWTSHRYLFQGH